MQAYDINAFFIDITLVHTFNEEDIEILITTIW